MLERLRISARGARRDGKFWIALLDALRETATGAGRARLWVRLVHRDAAHQITEYTEAERYADLFDLVARHRPDAARILSFGCSTGEEIDAIRRRFPDAEIVGAEINPRSRMLAKRRHAEDARVRVVAAIDREARFDIVFALGVLQFQPMRILGEGITDLSGIYPFERFDRGVSTLCAALSDGGLLCVMHAHYRVEDASCAGLLTAVAEGPVRDDQLFDRGSQVMKAGKASSIFFKRPPGQDPPD